MEIVVGKFAGFCYGITNAVTKATELVGKQDKTYCLGELVHNRTIIDKLERQGFTIVNEVKESPKNSKLIIRAHGVPPEIYEMAKQNQNEVIDLTCPTVLKIHKEVEEKRKDNYIFIIGEKGHAEVVGTQGFSGENSFVIEEQEDIEKAIEKFKQSNIQKLFIISQTTFELTKCEKFINIILEELKDYEVKVNKSVCNATRIRQEETDQISKEVDYMIIIGGKNSSNTTKLYEISRKNCKSIHIQTKEQLDMDEIKKYKKIGVTAGASTPKESIEEVVEVLEGIARK